MISCARRVVENPAKVIQAMGIETMKMNGIGIYE